MLLFPKCDVLFRSGRANLNYRDITRHDRQNEEYEQGDTDEDGYHNQYSFANIF